MPELRPTPRSSSVRSTRVTSAPALRAHAAALTPPKPAPTTTTLGMTNFAQSSDISITRGLAQGGSSMSSSPVRRWVGKPIKTKEDRRFVQGKGLYSDDIQLKQTLYAAVLRSP